MQDHIPGLQNRTETHEQDCEIGLRERIMEKDCGIRIMREKKPLSKTLLIYHVVNAFILSHSQYTYYRDNPPKET